MVTWTSVRVYMYHVTYDGPQSHLQMYHNHRDRDERPLRHPLCDGCLLAVVFPGLRQMSAINNVLIWWPSWRVVGETVAGRDDKPAANPLTDAPLGFVTGRRVIVHKLISDFGRMRLSAVSAVFACIGRIVLPNLCKYTRSISEINTRVKRARACTCGGDELVVHYPTYNDTVMPEICWLQSIVPDVNR